MSCLGYEDLLRHMGHTIVCVTYGMGENVALECEDCSEILLNFDKEVL